MAAKREKIHFASVDELLGAPNMTGEGTEKIRIESIHPFKDHPFKVIDDDKMNDLVESVKANGILSPVLVRPDSKGGFEMISGHRRMHAAKLAELEEVPAIVKEMSDDEATIMMVDSNVQREEILPSERAFSLKMKMDALKRQGRRTDLEETSGTECQKLTGDQVGESFGLKDRQVRKYVKLTDLRPELMKGVNGEMKFEYFNGREVASNCYFIIPKALQTDPELRKLSVYAKYLYGLMLDRMKLSAKNNQVDNEGRAYIYYSTENIQKDLGIGRNTVFKLLEELDADGGVGLIERVKLGQGRTSRIYVMRIVEAEQEFCEEEDAEEHVQKFNNWDSEEKEEVSEAQNVNFKKFKKGTS